MQPLSRIASVHIVVQAWSSCSFSYFRWISMYKSSMSEICLSKVNFAPIPILWFVSFGHCFHATQLISCFNSTDMKRKRDGRLLCYLHYQLWKKYVSNFFLYHLPNQASELLDLIARRGILLATSYQEVLIFKPWIILEVLNVSPENHTVMIHHHNKLCL